MFCQQCFASNGLPAMCRQPYFISLLSVAMFRQPSLRLLGAELSFASAVLVVLQIAFVSPLVKFDQ